MKWRGIYITGASLGALALLLPGFASAVTIGGAAISTTKVISAIVPIVLALVLMVFVWGLGMFFFNPSDREKRIEGVNVMLKMVIVVFALLVIWGLNKAAQEALGAADMPPVLSETHYLYDWSA